MYVYSLYIDLPEAKTTLNGIFLAMTKHRLQANDVLKEFNKMWKKNFAFVSNTK